MEKTDIFPPGTRFAPTEAVKTCPAAENGTTDQTPQLCCDVKLMHHSSAAGFFELCGERK